MERAKNLAEPSEPSQNIIKNLRARASRAKCSSRITELERAEPNVYEKFSSPSEPSFGSSQRAKNEPKMSQKTSQKRAKTSQALLLHFQEVLSQAS